MTLSGQSFPGLWSYLPGSCGADGWVKAKGPEGHAALSDPYLYPLEAGL